MANKYRQQTFRGTFSCGHDGSVTVGGYSDEYRRDAADNRFGNGVCEACEAIRRQEEAEKAKEKARKLELPELSGSPKQIDWAVTIRQKLIDTVPDRIDELLEKRILDGTAKKLPIDYTIKNKERFMEFANTKVKRGDLEAFKKMNEEYLGFLKGGAIEEVKINLKEAFYKFIGTETRAKEYIDTRKTFERLVPSSYFEEEGSMMEYLIKFAPKTEAEKEEEEKIEEIKEELTIYPENYNGLKCEIILNENRIDLISPKDDEIIKTVKSLGYSWTGGAWSLELGITTEPTNDRIAELANHLMVKGFAVTVDSLEVKEKAINADYKPRCTRWIFRAGKELLRIKWDGMNNSLYETAKSIRGASWDRGMVVPVGMHKEIEDFANAYGFNFTESALEEIESYKNETIETVDVAPPVKEIKKKGLVDILNQPDEIIDDLVDK